MRVVIRDAAAADAGRCAEIYAPYVRDTAISFESEPPSTEEMARRIAEAQRAHAWLVLEDDGNVVGYAYGGPFMSRAAYQWATTVSVYLAAGRRRTGAGRALYEALFDRLTTRGHRTALAGIALPNDASVGLHRALGFEPVGTYRRVGWKHGRWHDVAWYRRALGDDDGPPVPLR
ncbi:N-acetyltransferase family protein [Blastococcus sp. CT_GayMR16]|nr:N-acetyltransferase family protein [Blastococcus sp. CT_GayMR16]